MKFENLNLTPALLRAVAEDGYTAPSPIQQQAIPPALEGKDILGCAQTGTGKTAAFALPILQRISTGRHNPKQRKIRALILTPTRELALQIAESFDSYGKYTQVKCLAIFGGVSDKPQIDTIRRGVDVLVATPGRLIDLLNRKEVDIATIDTLVMDEADRMLDMGFIHDVKRILKWVPAQKQTLFFSATMPKEIQNLVNSLLKNPVKIEVAPVSSTVDIIDQSVYFVDKANKRPLLYDTLRQYKDVSTLVFTRTKYGADKVVKDLRKQNITAMAIHGDKSQNARQRALQAFKSGELKILIATDIAARGIDVDDLQLVLNYELPNIPETYVHRIGRTGRAGAKGKAIAFCDFEEKAYLKDIEKLTGKKVPVVENHPYPMEIFEVIPKAPRPPRPPRSERAPKPRNTAQRGRR